MTSRQRILLSATVRSLMQGCFVKATKLPMPPERVELRSARPAEIRRARHMLRWKGDIKATMM